MSILASESQQFGRQVEYFSTARPESDLLNQSRLDVGPASRFFSRIGRLSGFEKLERLGNELLFSPLRKFGNETNIWVSSNLHVTEYLVKYFPAEKIVYWVHSLPAGRKENERFKKLMKLPLNLVTPSIAIYKEIWRLCQAPSIGVFHYHIPNFHSVEPPINSNCQIEVDLPNDRPVIFHGGGDGINKGKHLVERALQVVGRKRPLCLVAIGNRPRREESDKVLRIELEKMAPERLGLLISLSDICLMPSLWFENAPLLLLEYRAANRKVVASRSGGIEEYADRERTWFVENPNNVDEWIEKIEAALQSEKPPQSDLQTQKIISKSEWIEKWESLFQQIEARG